MGQCPIIPPQGLDDDDLSIATAPNQTRLWNFAPQACGPAGLDDLDNTPESLSKNFLKLHRPDRPQKNILDPSVVMESLSMQAEVLLRRRAESRRGRNSFGTEAMENLTIEVYNKVEDCADDDANSRIGGASIGGMSHKSDFAPSEMTTGTSKTRPISNSDKYAMKTKGKFGSPRKKFSVIDSLKGQQGMSSSFQTLDEENSIASGSMPAPRVLLTSPSMLSAPQSPRKPSSKYAFVTQCFGGVPTDLQRSEKANQYKSVLHLKMKASLIDFYQKKFLPRFPNAPTPAGLSQSLRPQPHFVPNNGSDLSSSSSNSDTVIDFGVIQSSPVKMLVDDSFFMDLAITGSLGLIRRNKIATRVVSPSGAQTNQKSPEHYVVLLNRRSGIPLAVCALKAPTGPPTVRIYATKQRVFGQRPAASTQKLGLNWADNFPLYSWAEIVADGEFPQQVRYSIYMASGSDGRFAAEPSYQASILEEGSPDIKVIGRNDIESMVTGCALISLKSDQQGNNPCFHLDVAQGIDPALFICFVAVMDEVLEKAMRNLYRTQKQQRMKRNEEVSPASTPMRL